MNPQLLIITIGYGTSLIITLGLGFFVLFSGAKKEARVPFFFMAIAIAIFEASFLLGTTASSQAFAYRAFLLNLTDIFIVAFNAHWIIASIGKVREHRRGLAAIYAAGTALFVFFLSAPERFLRVPMPKMYFRFYYEAGEWYWLMLVFFFAVVCYFYYWMLRAYRESSGIERNRLKYFIGTTTVGYGLGSMAFPLAFNIQWDPILSMFIGFYTIPLAYGIVRYQLMDIRVVIRRALIYSVLIAFTSGIIIGVSFLNNWFVQVIPGFQVWFVPFLAAIGAVIIGNLFWRKSHEADKLKYEFITVAAHKFRTPLTHIKWVADALLQRAETDEERRLIREIYKADERLVELADIMLEASREEGGKYPYALQSVSLAAVVAKVLASMSGDIEKKHIKIHSDIEAGLPMVHADPRRIHAALKVFIENAVLYTPDGGNIAISVRVAGKYLTYSIADTGIGIMKEDIPYIFDKFFRTHRAALIDTEGSGLGLFIAKTIIERHGGKVGVQSEGEDMGSRFWFSIPIER